MKNDTLAALKEIEKWSVVGMMTDLGKTEAMNYINKMTKAAIASLEAEAGRDGVCIDNEYYLLRHAVNQTSDEAMSDPLSEEEIETVHAIRKYLDKIARRLADRAVSREQLNNAIVKHLPSSLPAIPWQDILDELESLQLAPTVSQGVMGWISVKDRLPEIPEGKSAVSVLIATFDNGDGSRNIQWASWDGVEFSQLWGKHGETFSWEDVLDQITHWQHIPEAPHV